jgi:beta-lactamase class A
MASSGNRVSGRVRRTRFRRWYAVFVVIGVVIGSCVPGGYRGAWAADDWAAFDAALARVGPRVGFLAAEVVDGECETVHGYGEEQRLAIASTFKLYVLAGLAEQVAAGEANWDEKIVIRDELRSMPSGATAYEPAGTRRTLEELAMRMIRDSDNTATDHLIDRLGRERIEAALATFGHGAPEINVPLLLTRELFAMKMHAERDVVETYLAAPDAEQRDILSSRIDPIPINPNNWGHWTGPSWIDGLEWFASPLEVCEVLAALHEMADDPGLRPLGGILGANRGGVFGGRQWPFAGYKGGYEAGVINATWLLERADGRTFVVTAGFNDPSAYINQGLVWQVLPGVEGLLRGE